MYSPTSDLEVTMITSRPNRAFPKYFKETTLIKAFECKKMVSAELSIFFVCGQFVFRMKHTEVILGQHNTCVSINPTDPTF